MAPWQLDHGKTGADVSLSISQPRRRTAPAAATAVLCLPSSLPWPCPFPTIAGYAALVFGLAKLFCAKEEYEGQLSAIARQGSGSACRSLYGGLVRYKRTHTHADMHLELVSIGT